MTADPMTTSMSGRTPGNGGMPKGFVPGLILGFIVGAAAGAFLPDLLGQNPPTPSSKAIPATPRANREASETPVPTAGESPDPTQGETEQPSTRPDQPATPPTSGSTPKPDGPGSQPK